MECTEIMRPAVAARVREIFVCESGVAPAA